MATAFKVTLTELGKLFFNSKEKLTHVAGNEAVVAEGLNIFSSNGILAFPYSKKAIQQLHLDGSDAEFGRGRQAVNDPTYRKAKVFRKGSFSCNWHPSSAVLEKAKRILLQSSVADEVVHAELYCMNIYGPGDFFKDHVDTPQDGIGHFGSLVMCLPTSFSGGQLTVGLGSGATSFDWAADLKADKARIVWIALLADENHSIEPVESGYRITVTFHLFKRDVDTAPLQLNRIASHPVAVQFKTFLTENAVMREFREEHESLYFALNHSYPLHVLDSECYGYYGKTDKVEGTVLKGMDAALFQFLSDAGLSPDLVVYTNENVVDGGSHDDDDKTKTYVSKQFSCFNQFCNDWENEPMTSAELATKAFNADMEHGFWCTPASKAMPLTSSAGYGNEPHLKRYYGNLCIRVSMHGR